MAETITIGPVVPADDLESLVVPPGEVILQPDDYEECADCGSRIRKGVMVEVEGHQMTAMQAHTKRCAEQMAQQAEMAAQRGTPVLDDGEPEESTIEADTCADCGQPLDPDAVGVLCPECMAALSAVTAEASIGSEEPAVTTPERVEVSSQTEFNKAYKSGQQITITGGTVRLPKLPSGEKTVLVTDGNVTTGAGRWRVFASGGMVDLGDGALAVLRNQAQASVTDGRVGVFVLAYEQSGVKAASGTVFGFDQSHTFLGPKANGVFIDNAQVETFGECGVRLNGHAICTAEDGPNGGAVVIATEQSTLSAAGDTVVIAEKTATVESLVYSADREAGRPLEVQEEIKALLAHQGRLLQPAVAAKPVVKPELGFTPPQRPRV